MEQCAEHVDYQLPNQHTRVRYIMDAIQCNDAELQASLAAVRKDDALPTSMRNHFENAVTFLLPSDPVAKKRKSNNDGSRTYANVSSAAGVEVSSAMGTKPNAGKSGVELRYYKKKEYATLTNDQKDELREWRSKNKKGDKKGNKRNNNSEKDNESFSVTNKKQFRREIASVMKEVIEKQEVQSKKDVEEIREIREVLASFAEPNKSVGSTTAAVTADRASVAATKLQSILKRGSKPSSGKQD